MKPPSPLQNPESGPCCGCGTDPVRRKTLQLTVGAALATGLGVRPAWSAEDGPKKGDLLVAVNDEAKKPLTADDIRLESKPVIAYPYDPSANAVRDASRLNRVLLVRVDPSTLDGPTAGRAAGGVVAYSAFCTHQGCDVNSWVAADKALLCFCHFSKFAPQQEAAVVGGPAPRPLPALPIADKDGKLTVVDGFNAPPGKAA